MSRRTVGVEEELLLYDRGTTHLAKLGDVLADRPDGAGSLAELPSIEHEFKRQQIETATSPQAEMSALMAEIDAGRRHVARLADAYDAAPAAVATNPAAGAPVTTADPRYRSMMQAYGVIATAQLTCGMHVHVSVDSRDEGVGVIDRIRIWLPVLLAITANSPLSQGIDTGYASYRNVSWGLWPTAGPTDPFLSPEEYDRVVAGLIATGAALDDGMIYFDARLAAHYPTVEIRVMDVTPTPADAVLVAALCRALVDTAATAWGAGEAPPPGARPIVRGATWRAARHGIEGHLVEPTSGDLAPAREVVNRLVAHVRPALARHGDEELVEVGLEQLFARGNGARRQRDALARNGSVADVVAAAIAWTGAAVD